MPRALEEHGSGSERHDFLGLSSLHSSLPRRLLLSSKETLEGMEENDVESESVKFSKSNSHLDGREEKDVEGKKKGEEKPKVQQANGSRTKRVPRRKRKVPYLAKQKFDFDTSLPDYAELLREYREERRLEEKLNDMTSLGFYCHRRVDEVLSTCGELRRQPISPVTPLCQEDYPLNAAAADQADDDALGVLFHLECIQTKLVEQNNEQDVLSVLKVAFDSVKDREAEMTLVENILLSVRFAPLRGFAFSESYIEARLTAILNKLTDSFLEVIVRQLMLFFALRPQATIIHIFRNAPGLRSRAKDFQDIITKWAKEVASWKDVKRVMHQVMTDVIPWCTKEEALHLCTKELPGVLTATKEFEEVARGWAGGDALDDVLKLDVIESIAVAMVDLGGRAGDESRGALERLSSVLLSLIQEGCSEKFNWHCHRLLKDLRKLGMLLTGGVL